MTGPVAQHADFTRDVLGRYLCNGLDEAIAGTTDGGRPAPATWSSTSTAGTGALYDIATGGGGATQICSRGSALQPGAWNHCEITVSGDSYEVRLNDHLTTAYTNPDPARGVRAGRDPSSGFIGLQQHTGNVSFRAVRIRELTAAAVGTVVGGSTGVGG